MKIENYFSIRRGHNIYLKIFFFAKIIFLRKKSQKICIFWRTKILPIEDSSVYDSGRISGKICLEGTFLSGGHMLAKTVKLLENCNFDTD